MRRRSRAWSTAITRPWCGSPGPTCATRLSPRRSCRRSSLRTWLLRIVVNRAISTGVHERQHLPVDDSELGDDNGRFSQDGWWVAPPVHWADEAVDRMVLRNWRPAYASW